jgi:formylglycine-generating enzyme required for sulfatase activity
MKRLIPIFVLAAAGCGHWVDLNSDAFAPGSASEEQFKFDSTACAQKGEDARSYSVAGMAADNVDKHAIFNRTYAACMKAKGYQEATSALNFWQAYNL